MFFFSKVGLVEAQHFGDRLREQSQGTAQEGAVCGGGHQRSADRPAHFSGKLCRCLVTFDHFLHMPCASVCKFCRSAEWLECAPEFHVRFVQRVCDLHRLAVSHEARHDSEDVLIRNAILPLHAVVPKNDVIFLPDFYNAVQDVRPIGVPLVQDDLVVVEATVFVLFGEVTAKDGDQIAILVQQRLHTDANHPIGKRAVLLQVLFVTDFIHPALQCSAASPAPCRGRGMPRLRPRRTSPAWPPKAAPG